MKTIIGDLTGITLGFIWGRAGFSQKLIDRIIDGYIYVMLESEN